MIILQWNTLCVCITHIAHAYPIVHKVPLRFMIKCFSLISFFVCARGNECMKICSIDYCVSFSSTWYKQQPNGERQITKRQQPKRWKRIKKDDEKEAKSKINKHKQSVCVHRVYVFLCVLSHSAVTAVVSLSLLMWMFYFHSHSYMHTISTFSTKRNVKSLCLNTHTHTHTNTNTQSWI